MAARTLPNDRPPLRVVFRPDRYRRRWELVEAERRSLADRVAALPAPVWDEPSRCEGWRIRDVLGHLVHMAESTGKSLRADLRAAAPRERDQGFAICARQRGEQPVLELCQRLRDAAPSRFNGMPTVALSEVVIHGDDMLEPAGGRADLSDETAVACLDLMRMVNLYAAKFAYRGHPYRGVRLEATDVNWSAGRGPEVTGTALDLLAVLSNRRGAVERLSGPGVPKLVGPYLARHAG